MRTELFKQVADQVGGFASVPNLTSLPAVSRSSRCTLSGSSARAPVSSIPDLSAWRSPRLCSGPSRHQPHQSGLTELRGRVAVKPEGPRKGGAGVWQDRVVTGCRGRNLGDAAHADRVMVAAGETGLTGGRAEPVVWNRLYRRPLAASFSKFGVWHGPPKALDAPKPTSSMRTSRTFGAPVGGRNCRIGGYFVFGSLAS